MARKAGRPKGAKTTYKCRECKGPKTLSSSGVWRCLPCEAARSAARYEARKVCPKCGGLRVMVTWSSGRRGMVCRPCEALRDKERRVYRAVTAPRSGNWDAADHEPRWSHKMLALYDAHRARRMRTP